MDIKTKRAQSVIFAHAKGYRVKEDGSAINPNKLALKCSIIDNSYKYFNVRINKKPMKVFVHLLQAYQKYGIKVFQTYCVRHNNGKSVDNSYDNILIGSQSENLMDVDSKNRINHSVLATSSRNRFSPDMQLVIYNDYLNGMGCRSLAKKYEIPYSTMGDLIRRIKSKNTKQAA